jgi:excisionase family DNA binding protein
VLLTAEQVADVAGAKSWVYEAPERRIPHVKLGRYVRFEREQLDTWLVPICAGSCCYSPRSVVPRV